MACYYDVLLIGIPVTFLGVSLTALLAGLSVLAIPVGALVAITLVGHGLFVRGPVDSIPSPVRDVKVSPRSDPDTSTPASSHTNE